MMGKSAYHPITDLVLLVPGFVGFEQIGGDDYFDEAIVDALRHALQTRQLMSSAVDAEFSIEVLSSVSAGNLLQRQAALISELAEVLEYPAHYDVKRIHLIGHGTGGVDARLLLANRRLDGRPWASPERALRDRIRSVLCVGAPQHGTRLVDHPDLRDLVRSLPRFLLARSFDTELWAALGAGLRDMDTVALLRTALRRPAQAWALVTSVAEHQELLRELRPEAMVAHRNALPGLPDVQLGTVVTLAADHVELSATPSRGGVLGKLERYAKDLRGRRAAPKARRADAMFRWLRSRTANPYWEADDARDARTEAAAAQRIQDVLDRRGPGRAVRVIGNPRAVLPCPIDGRVSDGLVNATRQLLRPDDDDELVAVVIGDHLDVAGHFDKVSHPCCAEDQGLFRSGSGFSHEQLHQLCELLAERIERARVPPRADSGVISVAPARISASQA